MKKYLSTFFLLNLSLLILFACQEKKQEKSAVSEPLSKIEATTATNTISKTSPDPHVHLNKLDDSLKVADRCKQCHQKEYNDWMQSHHEKAMKVATEKTVLGNFNNQSFTHHGVTSTMYKKDGGFYIKTQNGEGKLEEYKVAYTFGVTPLQQYIAEFPNGRKQCLHVAWDDVSKKWYNLYPDTKISPDEWLHWSRGSQNWNQMCADCHSTELKKNYDQKTETYHTSWKDINVSCEACHGPGAEHVRANSSPHQAQDSQQQNRNRKMCPLPFPSLPNF